MTRQHSHPRATAVALLAGLTGLVTALVTVLAPAASQAAPDRPSPGGSFQEQYRPQYHFTPEKNWMNDPNGLVWYDGEYHLFFQHNPEGDRWGNMSWGHAVSTDLVHWEELPLAIKYSADEAIFSGSAVVDRENTSGFGKPGKPAMVAIYTSAYSSGTQAQSLAYSTDRGRTWTKYAGNPVLDIGSREFRDPKVQWYAPTKSWLMTVSRSTEHRVAFYTSKNLKDWDLLSEFGPQGATGGVWECPDLFPLLLDGDPRKKKWVLVVNINPGGIQGGSAAQYFVGDFDGTTFTPDDDGSYTPPAGTVVQDFESGYDGWSATGTAFGDAPASGTLPGQQEVTGFTGQGLVNSFRDGDATTGVLRSPDFTLDQRYLSFQLGGGRHPHVPGGGDGAPPAGTVLADFEGENLPEGWTATGGLANLRPRAGNLPNQQGAKALDTFVTDGERAGDEPVGDPATGTVTSPEFTLSTRYLNLLVAGGKHPWGGDDPTAVNLLVDGQVVQTATGLDSGEMTPRAWDVSAYAGKQARLQVVDEATGGWGHLMVDHVVASDQPWKPIDNQTGVNLVVDGEVVRTATGQDSESLDWTSWDLADLQGKKAHVEVVDRNTGGWGHVLADQFTLAGAPARSALQRADWVDWGKDYYAAVSWEDDPTGKRHMIGWMNNWQYANDIPTSPWRSAMSVPREMSLETVDGRAQLVQQPVSTLSSLRRPAASVGRQPVVEGVHVLRQGGKPVTGKAYELEATFRPGTADRVGLHLRTGGGQRTVVGYDAATQEVYVDRRESGADGFSADFADAVQRAPLALGEDGTVHLRVLVDWSSVEVFADGGRRVITDQVFPDDTSQGISVFAEGGTARLEKLKTWSMASYR